MRHFVLVAAALLLGGCGYVGDPLPPALNIPSRITDLEVVQRGDKLLLRFTAPAVTTEQLPIREFERLDLRIGPPAPSMEAWEPASTAVPVTVPEPGATVTAEAPASQWTGREVLVAVRLVSTRGREADWSNSVVLTPRAPLPTPVPVAAAHPDGVQVRWDEIPGAKYRVRKESGETAVVEKGVYVDTAVELGKTYTYNVQAVAGLIESELSKPVTITARDEFAPKPPAGVTIVAGANSVELAWERNTAPDLGIYRVYRADGAGEFKVLADAVDALAYSDRQVDSGKTYRYQVTAVDRSGNESEPSAIVEATTL